jgi:hypothetical protein
MKHLYVFAVIVILLLGILAVTVGCMNRAATTPSPATTVTSFPTKAFIPGVNNASSKSTNGLSLTLSLDAATYQTGQRITIALDEKNMLAATNNIPASDQWPYDGLGLGSRCASYGSPFGIALFQGNYNSSDYSTATQLYLYDPNGIYLCQPALTGISYAHYTFQSSSDITQFGQEIFEFMMKGYWPDKKDSEYTRLDPGVYTVVAGDEWGALVLVHFTVTETVTTTTTSPIENPPVAVQSIDKTADRGQTPTVQIVLRNMSAESIISLHAVLEEFAPEDYNFSFDVTAVKPLTPGSVSLAARELFQGQFGAGIPYDLIISGMYQSGKTFSFTWEPPAN